MKGLVFCLIVIPHILTHPTIPKHTSNFNTFTAAVYKQISETEEGNLLVSPLSIIPLLALLQFGSAGKTTQQIASILQIHSSEELQEIIKTLKNDLFKDSSCLAQTSSKMYLKKSIPIKKDFSDMANEYCDTPIEHIDFRRRFQTTTIINDWVQKEVHDKTSLIVYPNMINFLTKAVLVNTFHLEANWSLQFSSTNTKDSDCYQRAESNAEMMHLQGGNFSYYENEELGARFLELPFEYGAGSMVIILPNNETVLPHLEEHIEKVFEIPNFTVKFLNHVALPKFKIDANVDFKNTLMKLGMVRAFTKSGADFSGIAAKDSNLVINEFLQKIVMEVGEEGLHSGTTSTKNNFDIPLNGPVDSNSNFVADRPFLFYVKINKMVVLAGRVVTPSSINIL